MSAYRIELTRRAVKDLRRLDANVRERVLAAIEQASSSPEQSALSRLVGEPPRFKLRVGDWRAIIALDAGQRVLTVLHVDHRSRVYKRP